MPTKRGIKRKNSDKFGSSRSSKRRAIVTARSATERPRRKAALEAGKSISRSYGLLRDGTEVVDEANITLKGASSDPFHDSKFMQDELAPADVADPDLDNDIHPLFQPNMFPNVDYGPIEMPARLATKLLTSRALQPMLYTMLSTTPCRRRGRNSGWHYKPADDVRNRKISTKVAATIARQLEALATMVRFVIDANVDGHALSNTSQDKKLTHPMFPGGQGTVTHFSQALYDKLPAPTEDSAVDWPFHRTVQFDFAVTLVHEVFHQLDNAVGADRNIEPFFGDAAIAEVGFEAEYRLFGGRMMSLFDEGGDDDDDEEIRPYRLDPDHDTMRSAARGLRIIWEWPSARMVIEYQGSGFKLFVKKAQIPSLDLAWRVPITYFAEVFTKSFWKLARRRDSDLHAPKGVGCYFRTNRRGSSEAQKPPERLIPSGCKKVRKDAYAIEAKHS